MPAVHKWNLKVRRLPIGLLLWLAAGSGFAQQSSLPLNRDYLSLLEANPEFTRSGFHSSIRPFLKAEVDAALNFDSVLWQTTPGFMKFGHDSLPQQSRPNNLAVSPVVDLGWGRDMRTAGSYFVTGAGVSGALDLGNKFSTSVRYFTGNRGFVHYVDSFILGSEVVPGEGYAHPTKEGYAYSNFEGYVSYAPSRHFNFQAGQGKNFFGDGYRSLLLSDAAYSYPFIKISTTVWKIKYVNLFTAMNEVYGSGGHSGKYRRKYAAFHYLSLNAARWLNISLFEAVVWSGQDSSGVRGYDVNYLNPVIFYRPVEFSLGSSDNALIGANASAALGRSVKLYGQVILDEFYLVHIRAQDGWWANKQGFQVGLKAIQRFGQTSASWRIEYNRVRPYTYSHGLSTQNYAHSGQPLAHSLGANFSELLSRLRLIRGPWMVNLGLIYALKGEDAPGSNWGGNIFLDYTNPREREFGNVTGQGIATTTMMESLRVAYLLYPEINLRLECGMVNRNSVSSIKEDNSLLLFIGLKTDLGNTYHDF